MNFYFVNPYVLVSSYKIQPRRQRKRGQQKSTINQNEVTMGESSNTIDLPETDAMATRKEEKENESIAINESRINCITVLQYSVYRHKKKIHDST